jgi:succinate-semialdehyde dehydrogenase/glutarate-semialdehyde dehydrogenase
VTTQKNVSDVGKELCESTSVRKITFTGSTSVAKLLYRMTSSTMKKFVGRSLPQKAALNHKFRVSFEAGGNAPFIVFDDADIDAAVEGLSSLTAPGQRD